jgi:hypothetical protein
MLTTERFDRIRRLALDLVRTGLVARHPDLVERRSRGARVDRLRGHRP